MTFSKQNQSPEQIAQQQFADDCARKFDSIERYKREAHMQIPIVRDECRSYISRLEDRICTLEALLSKQ